MEIISAVVAVLAVCVVWWVMKSLATLVGVITIGGLAYYAHSTYPNWVDTLTTIVHNWAMQ